VSQVADIETLAWSPLVVEALAEILVAVVADGGSVSFMHPLSSADAEAFWDESLEATATLAFAPWPNQPHRAEIAKLMTAPEHRGRGLATALVREAEQVAIARGRTLLTLDTAEEDGAAGLYDRLGYVRAGYIPGYALKPHGGLTGTILYYKRLESRASN